MMKSRQFHQITSRFTIMLVITLSGRSAVAKTDVTTPTKYLAFQVFIGSPSPNIPIGGSGSQPLSPPPSKAAMKLLVQNIVDQIGGTGDQQHKLAFIIGPLAFDLTDAQLQQMIRDAFEIAAEMNIAVGFHIDDSMFWARRSDLWKDPKNVEWLDWEGTPNTGRRIDWGPQPTKFSPQLCFNIAAIQMEFQRLPNKIIVTPTTQYVNS